MNPWIEHVKAYAKKHGISYREAMKKARPSYKPGKRRQRGKGVLDTIKKGLDVVSGDVAQSVRHVFNSNPKSRKGFAGERHGVRMADPYKGSSYNYMGQHGPK